MMTTPIQHPLDYDYEPYFMSDLDNMAIKREIPGFRIYPQDRPEEFIAQTNEDLPCDVQEAHARLFTAAPELLDALEFFFNIMHDHECSVRKGYVKHAMDMARAAIAKATGGHV